MNESGRGEIDGKRYYFTFSMNSVHCPSPGWLNYPASFSAPAARYHQQGRKSAPAKYAASGHRDPSQVISQASFRKTNSICDPQRMGVKTWNIPKGPREVFCNFSGSQEKGFSHFKYWLFRLGSPPRAAAELYWVYAEEGSALCLGQRWMSALQPVGMEVFHNWGCFSSC